LAGLSLALLAIPIAHAQYSGKVLAPIGTTASFGQGAGGGLQVGYAFTNGTAGNAHAYMWTGTAASAVDLTPSVCANAEAIAVSGGIEAGWAFRSDVQQMHALAWSGTAASFLDLNPSGFNTSQGLAILGTTMVGCAQNQETDSNGKITTITLYHAIVWSGIGTPSYHAFDINPNGMDGSVADGISPAGQVGYAWGRSTSGNNHAIYWQTGIATDLNPQGFTMSEALGLATLYQVGYARGSSTGSLDHAFLWKSTKQSGVDLNPSGFSDSKALAIATGFEVGYGTPTGQPGTSHALVWQGTAASAVDLNRFLSKYSMVGSVATGIDTSGNIVGRAYDAAGNWYAVIWTTPHL
jgi:hypothetical protein